MKTKQSFSHFLIHQIVLIFCFLNLNAIISVKYYLSSFYVGEGHLGMSSNCCDFHPALQLVQLWINFLLSFPLTSISSAPGPRKIKEEKEVQAVKTLRSMLITGHLIRLFSHEQTALPVRGDLLVQQYIKIIKLNLI